MSDSEEIWLYLLKESKLLDNIPDALKGDAAFEAYFEASRRARFTAKENKQYIDDMMNEWDIANAKREAEERAEARGRAEGEAKGRAEGKAEGEAKGKAEEKIAIAAKMLKTGLPIDVIVEITGLPEAQVKRLA